MSDLNWIFTIKGPQHWKTWLYCMQTDHAHARSPISAFITCLSESILMLKVSKGAKIRNRYNLIQHPTQDTNGKVTNSQLDTTNESQEVSPFPAGDHKAHINRRTQRRCKHKTEQKHKRSTKEVPPWNGQ